ncbi:hypothetical protein ACFVRD_25725 [Streptomyces sp. NPDC057908]
MTRYLLTQGVEVFEVNRPDRSDRRFRGKSDPSMRRMPPGRY